ncbi:pre-peptidase C-terminal domain-containing protein [Microcoleus sp. FACHB-1515]|uniref:CAP domain-containing protein n=1 Tax=Cyanophyceae TaxID=3028117 RepID=UPI0016849B84|nr:CAP domain-containing protein [Microcoleus sp. FACHB-1515]MBD2089205.1 pre-peptidase C-terminal domain-containing protein [Microcoleus sp. FACHB-1515]
MSFRLNSAQSLKVRSNPVRLNDRLGDDHKLYQFNLKQRSSLNLKLRSLGANADVELIQDRDRDGRAELGETVASSRSASGLDAIDIQGLSAGTYFLRVLPKSDDAMRYRLQVAATRTNKVSEAYEIVQRTNAFRESKGLPALAVNTQLTQAAHAYARSLAIDDNWSHTGKDGSSPWDRIKAAGYDFSQAAENLAAGHTTAESAMRGWINSPGHRANMLAYQVQEIGVGYFVLKPDPGRFTFSSYWSQSMGTPIDVRVIPNVPDNGRNG